MLPDAAQVQWSGPAKPSIAGRRQDRPGPATVGRAVSAFDQPGPNEPVDQPRDPTATQPNSLRKFGHSKPAAGGHPQLREDVEFSQRHPLAGEQLSFQAPQQGGLGVQEGAPGAQLGGFQLTGHRNILPHYFVVMNNVA